MSSSSPSELNASARHAKADMPGMLRPKMSLIVSTLARTEPLDNFLSHLDSQTFQDFEVVLVDQNEDRRVDTLFERHFFRKSHVRSNERGLSRGRNAGLAEAHGEILAIPDDDCWYPPTLLADVIAFFGKRADVDVLAVVECDPDGKPMVPRQPPSAGWCVSRPDGLFRYRNAWMAQSSMIFLRRHVYEQIGCFSTWMGVGGGTQFQSGEETDYLLRALRAGFRMWFEPSIRVFHPPLRTPERLATSNYRYAVGGGGLMRRHGVSVFALAGALCRCLGGAVFSLLKYDWLKAKMYVRRAKGLAIGYFSLPPDLKINSG